MAVILPLALLVSVATWCAGGRRSGTLQQAIALALSEVIVLTGVLGLAACSSPGSPAPAAQSQPSGSAGPGSAGTPAPASAGNSQVTADAIALLKTGAADPALTPTDVERQAATVGNDPAALFAYVHDHIRTEIYSGVLRGARGTLTGGAGNAWDQALLLAAMLKHHGRDVRFAHAQLADADASKIVARMFADAARPLPAPPKVAVSDALRTQSQAMLQRVRATWKQSSTDVFDTLKQGGLALGDRAVTRQALTSEAADHAWVEYRDGDRWVPLDPAGADRPGAAIAPAADTFAQVPAAKYHRVVIHVTAEVRHDQQLETKDVLRYETTADVVHGVPVFLWHHFDNDIAGHWRAMPLLIVGGQLYGAMKINAVGLVKVAPPKGDLIGQAHQAVGQLGSVTDAFKTDGPAPATAGAAALTAERLEIEFADPSGHTETVRRDLLDRIGVTARTGGTAATAPLSPVPEVDNRPVPLETIYACAFAAGPLDPVSVFRELAAKPGALEAAVTLRDRSGRGTSDAETAKLAAAVKDGVWAMLSTTAATAALLSQRLAPQIDDARKTIFYEATPRLVIAETSFTASADGKSIVPSLGIDLRRDAVRAVSPDANAAALVRANASRGILDGVIEDTLMAAGSPGGAYSAVGVMTRARTQQGGLVSLHDAAAVGQLRLSPEAQSRMAADVRNGLAVVTARTSGQQADASRAGWWSIDLSTGDTVAMIQSGLHGSQEMPEDMALADTVEVPAARVLGAGVKPPPPPPFGAWNHPAFLGFYVGCAVTFVLMAVVGYFVLVKGM